MGRRPCCSKVGLNRGLWSAGEDELLVDYIKKNGDGHWRDLPMRAGLKRCGKSCRLRWLNYLRPDIKRGNISPEEEDLIVRLHKLLGNRWSLIAGRLPGRTDNEIKNYWNTNLSKRTGSQSSEYHISSRSEGTDRGQQLSSKQEQLQEIRKKTVRCAKAVVLPQENHLRAKAETECPSLLSLPEDDSYFNLLMDLEIMDFDFLQDFGYETNMRSNMISEENAGSSNYLSPTT